MTMRTPGHDRELAAGFLVTEQIIRQHRDLKDIAVCRSSLGRETRWMFFLRRAWKWISQG